MNILRIRSPVSQAERPSSSFDRTATNPPLRSSSCTCCCALCRPGIITEVSWRRSSSERSSAAMGCGGRLICSDGPVPGTSIVRARTACCRVFCPERIARLSFSPRSSAPHSALPRPRARTRAGSSTGSGISFIISSMCTRYNGRAAMSAARRSRYSSSIGVAELPVGPQRTFEKKFSQHKVSSRSNVTPSSSRYPIDAASGANIWSRLRKGPELVTRRTPFAASAKMRLLPWNASPRGREVVASRARSSCCVPRLPWSAESSE
mmetsp:Transcript_14818/g.43866  ORF Transcript_14818/g.43866 Transcript_14818/m.43866 type:complete len:264 (-) Transcript_14818:2207-2998(-)